MCSLLRFSDPKKDTDNATNLAMLGTRVKVVTVVEIVAAAVDEKKAVKRSETLRSILVSLEWLRTVQDGSASLVQ